MSRGAINSPHFDKKILGSLSLHSHNFIDPQQCWKYQPPRAYRWKFYLSGRLEKFSHVGHHISDRQRKNAYLDRFYGRSHQLSRKGATVILAKRYWRKMFESSERVLEYFEVSRRKSWYWEKMADKKLNLARTNRMSWGQNCWAEGHQWNTWEWAGWGKERSPVSEVQIQARNQTPHHAHGCLKSNWKNNIPWIIAGPAWTVTDRWWE